MKLGPYETNNIYCGECSEAMAALPDSCIDLTVTSPPYDNLRKYNGFVFPFEQIAGQLYRVTKPGGVVVWVVGDATINGSETLTSFRQALYFRGMGFNLHDTMIYIKTGYLPQHNNRYEPVFEFMFVFAKDEPKTFNPIKEKAIYNSGGKMGHRKISGNHQNSRWNRNEYKTLTNVWTIKTGGGLSASDDTAFAHPAIFPEALARDHILSWSNPGDLILDPMCGSGTTLKMSVVTGRQYLGFDISQEYCDLARRRVGEVEREQRKEWKQIRDNGKLDDLPLFASEGMAVEILT